MDKIITAENLIFEYKDEETDAVTEVLKGISLDIERGEFVAVLGHNGSGKSTFAKHLNAILTPTSGRVCVCGTDTSDEDKLFDIRRRVGMVFQNPDNQMVANIVEDDVAVAPENLGLPREEIRRRVDKCACRGEYVGFCKARAAYAFGRTEAENCHRGGFGDGTRDNRIGRADGNA